MIIKCAIYDGEIILTTDPELLPPNAVIGEYEVTQLKSGKFVLSSDYRALREAEYPKIGDQLDDLFKQGLFSAGIAEKIQSVKDKYPK